MTAAAACSPAVQRVLDRLPGAKRQGDGFIARCPAHDDHTPSLAITEGRDGRAVLHCHAGCTKKGAHKVVSALGLTMADLFPDRQPSFASNGAGATAPAPTADRPAIVRTYDYLDADGALLFQVCRLEPKGFRQRRPDGNGGWLWNMDGVERVLYRLPELIDALAHERTVYIVEGEKDVDALVARGLPATTNPGGARKWTGDYSARFRDADVVILPDNDDAGRDHAEMVQNSLLAAGARQVRVVHLPGLPPKGDVSDWLAMGNTTDALTALVAQAPARTAASLQAETRTRWRLDELLENEELMRPPAPVVPHVAFAARSTLLAAREKSGKSTLTGFIAAQVSRGGWFLGERCAEGVVLIAGLEEYLGDAARRLRQFQADPARVYLVDRLPSDLQERLATLRAHVEATHPILLIVDTLMAYSSAAVSDASSSAQMQPVVHELTRLAHELGVALILVHHGRKADGGYRDSSAIGAAVDAIIEIFAEDKEERTDPTKRYARARGRMPLRDFSFRFDGRTFTLADGRAAAVSVDAQILAAVRAAPGCSVRHLRDHLKFSDAVIIDAVTRLLHADPPMLADHGSNNRHALVIPDSAAGAHF
jgi:hypothetical protein